MQNISIRRPNELDIEQLHHLFEVTIADTFEKQGVGDDLEGINGEIEEKKHYLREDLESKGAERFFLVASYQGKIVGTIAYGPGSKLIEDGSNGKLKDIGEIGTVFVLPEYQKRGIGTLLVNSIFIALLSRNIEEFCLDSGYTRAQRVWRKKLGDPTMIIKDYWGEGFDHLIWHRKLKDMQIIYKTF